MSLSPNDIRNYEFPSQMRGYDKEEVDSFLDQVASTLENLKQESLRLSMESDSLKSQFDSLKQFEDTIKGAAIDARKNANATMATAKAEAEKILSDAKLKAEELVSSKEAMISEYKKQLNRLEHTKASYTAELKDMMNVHLAMIDKISESEFSYTTESDSSFDITNSSEVKRDEMTSVGTKSTKEQIVTEEVNAVSEIIHATEDAPIDPELEEALAGYVHPVPTQPEINSDTMIGVRVSPKLGQVIETTKRAEDIPEGFIVGNAVEEDEELALDDGDTGKMTLAPDASDANCEHNAISIDEHPVTPENIVQELDNVVAKFEEELDKAESK